MNPFPAVFVSDEIADALGDNAWLEAVLDCERALVNAGALAGIVPIPSAVAVAEACDPAGFDAGAVARGTREHGDPVAAVVAQLRERVGAEHVEGLRTHVGNEGVLGDASSLVARTVVHLLAAELDAAADLATQQGDEGAVWRRALTEARSALFDSSTGLSTRLGRAGDRVAGFEELLPLYAAELELQVEGQGHETARLVRELAATVDVAATISRELVQVRPADGESPAAARVAAACAAHARVNASLLLDDLAAEECGWQLQWPALRTLLAATGGAVGAVGELLAGSPDRVLA